MCRHNLYYFLILEKPSHKNFIIISHFWLHSGLFIFFFHFSAMSCAACMHFISLHEKQAIFYTYSHRKGVTLCRGNKITTIKKSKREKTEFAGNMAENGLY